MTERNIVDLKTKAKIVMQFAYENQNESLADDFFEYNDMGVPLSIAYHNELCVMTEKGSKLIEETFNNVCDEMEVPNNLEYEDITDLHDEWRKTHDGWGGELPE